MRTHTLGRDLNNYLLAVTQRIHYDDMKVMDFCADTHYGKQSVMGIWMGKGMVRLAGQVFWTPH